jgi:hypothetical protein
LKQFKVGIPASGLGFSITDFGLKGFQIIIGEPFELGYACFQGSGVKSESIYRLGM